MLAVQPYRVIKGQANVTLGCVGKRGGASTFVCQGKSDFAVIDPSAQLPYCWVALTVENQDLPVEWPSMAKRFYWGISKIQSTETQPGPLMAIY
jgi:hypothetical protein